MQNLYNSLTNPIIEYKDNGEILQHPPTAVMLRAARVLKELDSINTANGLVINQQSTQINELHEQLRIVNESLREVREQISNVGSSGILDQRNDSTSEAGVPPEGGNPGTS